MALELRPNCECCDRDLPPASTLARICTFECTFCADCVDNVLFNVCPNCGGGFEPRPIRPSTEWRPGLSVAKRPPSTKRVVFFLQSRRHCGALAAHQEHSARGALTCKDRYSSLPIMRSTEYGPPPRIAIKNSTMPSRSTYS